MANPRMTKVLFDHQKFSTQRYGGISRYFATLIDAIAAAPDVSSETSVLYCENQYLPTLLQPLNTPFLSPFFKTKAGRSMVYKLNKYHSEKAVQKADFDVFHPTYYDPYFLPYLKKPLVTTIHDMTYERMPEYFWAQDPLTAFKRRSIERADAIIAISETTKADLIAYSPAVDPGKIKVIYHGLDLDTPLRLQPVSALPEHYILYVGDRSGYKNFFLFMDACCEILKQDKAIEVVLAGGGPLGIAEKEYLNRNRVAGRVWHIHATDAELNFLFAKALLFVYPSLHEGFGLPILEAFKAGCPVLLSDTPCFREIGGGAVHYFEALSKESLIAAITALIRDDHARARLVEAGSARLLDFPISRCVDQTLGLYKSLT